jgi:AcrR family transcriptional regulator
MPRTAQPYHRENLEGLLIAKAAEIVAERGIEALSLRELGRLANVSRSAPYHYFADKSALLYRVGEEGFRALSGRIAQAFADVDDPLTQLRLGLTGYVRFAEEQPHFFRLMFADVLRRDVLADPLADDARIAFSSPAAAEAFGMLYQGVLRLQQGRTLRAGDPLLVLNVFWAFAHGVAVLALGGHLKLKDSVDVLDAGLDALIRAYAPPSERD